jgi:uncharacterized flavoprotein (TIGR03862 family)
MSLTFSAPRVVVIGAGPAGLMAAEVLQVQGAQVQVFDAMASAGRKLLRAGIGGLNLTHAEPYERFVTRYFERAPECQSWLDAWGPNALRDWALGLGIETFVGSSQRVFPVGMKAAPLLRAWLKRLQDPSHPVPVQFFMRHRWTGELQSASSTNRPDVTGAPWILGFQTPQGHCEVIADAVVLALGGGSWPQLGSNGAWVPALAEAGVDIAPLQPANCGFDVQAQLSNGWSHYFQTRYAGTPLKSVVLSHTPPQGEAFSRKGELVLTHTGLEGSLVYAASKGLREALVLKGFTTLHLDLKPDWTEERLTSVLAQPRGKRSLSNVLQGKVGLAPVHTALLREVLPKEVFTEAQLLAQGIKHLPLTLVAPRPLNEAISTAGGVRFEALNAGSMIKAMPGVFVAGEMLDWEAPTGGYLLTACMASGRMAGAGALEHLRKKAPQ